MNNLNKIMAGAVMCTAPLLLPVDAYAADAHLPAKDKQMVKSAMLAAPARVARGATIVGLQYRRLDADPGRADRVW
jgi:hypothetical protein